MIVQNRAITIKKNKKTFYLFIYMYKFLSCGLYLFPNPAAPPPLHLPHDLLSDGMRLYVGT